MTHYPYTAHAPDGETASVNRKASELAGTALMTAFTGLRFDPVAAYEEHSDPCVVWLRSMMTGRVAKTGAELRIERISRFRMSDGRVVEAWEFRPLPPGLSSASVPSATSAREAA